MSSDVAMAAPTGLQAELWPDELDRRLMEADEAVRASRHTGDRLAVEKRQAIIESLAEGNGILRTARLCQTSPHVVTAIRERCQQLVAIEEKQLSRRYARILALSAERYEEALINGTIPAAQIPVGHGIFADKKALLDGKPTAIVEHREALSVEAINDLVDRLPRVPGVVIDVGSSDSGSDGGGENAP